jgi:hypothetical protein
MKPLIIYGCGAMARMVAQYAESEHEVIAFTVDKCCINKNELDGLPVVPFDELVACRPPRSGNGDGLR